MTLIINMDEGKKICEIKGCDGGRLCFAKNE